ncbi:MAG: VWA domain-containing protein, partial [Verrucomicrobiaceae bacterium]
MQTIRFSRPGLLAAAMLFTDASVRAEPTSLELILDCSASMWNKLEDGRYRIDGAKQVLSGFLATTSDSADLHIGLRIYGSKVAFGKPGACDDSVLVAPVEGFARSKMLEEVKNARAVGATPLAKNLELAKADFTKPGIRRLIVFTDGEESCDGDVRGALASLKEAGIDVDVKIIGIG